MQRPIILAEVRAIIIMIAAINLSATPARSPTAPYR